MSPPPSNVTTAGVDAGVLFEPLQRLALQRRRIRRAPSPHPGARPIEHLLQRLERRVRRRVHHFGIEEDVHERLEIVVAHRGRLSSDVYMNVGVVA